MQKTLQLVIILGSLLLLSQLGCFHPYNKQVGNHLQSEDRRSTALKGKHKPRGHNENQNRLLLTQQDMTRLLSCHSSHSLSGRKHYLCFAAGGTKDKSDNMRKGKRPESKPRTQLGISAQRFLPSVQRPWWIKNESHGNSEVKKANSLQIYEVPWSICVYEFWDLQPVWVKDLPQPLAPLYTKSLECLG